MEKRFDHIISLGLNCEISFILKKSLTLLKVLCYHGVTFLFQALMMY